MGKGIKIPKISKAAVLSFFLAAALCSPLIFVSITNRSNIENLLLEQFVMEKTFRINEMLSRLLSKANSLSVIIKQRNGSIEDFYRIAPIIADEPVILNILAAPGGTVTDVFPAEGNQNLIGLALPNGSASGWKAAVRDSQGMILDGPFDLASGGQALAGSLAVFLDTENEDSNFWGLVSVALKFPEVINSTGFENLTDRGYSFELWRTNPGTGEKQVIMSSHQTPPADNNYIEKHIPVMNADWHLTVWPVRLWYGYPENIILAAAGFLVSVLVFFVVQNNFTLNNARLALEELAKSDPLTGINNRRNFMDVSRLIIERARRHNEDCYIILFDLDKFKNVNDHYGHTIGDKVLIEVAARIKAAIRPYDLFARYGGEEFIICAPEITRNDMVAVAERLRRCVCDKIFVYDYLRFPSSASFGIARIENSDIQKAILNADVALYSAKKNGRNTCVFYNSDLPPLADAKINTV